MTSNGDRPTPPHGIAPTVRVLAQKSSQHDSDITELRAGMGRVEGMVGGLMGEVGALAGRVDSLSSDVRHVLRVASSPPPPPMRSEAPSGLDLLLEEADEIKAAAAEGERRPDTTPDEQVAPVLRRLRDRKELADFRKAKAHAKGVALWLLGVVVTAIITAYVTLLVTGHQ